jgi:ribosome-associated protein
LAANAALEKKATDLVIFHVAKLTTIADYFLICSADSQRQAKAIMDNIDAALAQAGEKTFSVEGEGAMLWVLMDYSDLIIHIFKDEIRAFYALERLWGDAPRLKVSELSRSRKKAAPQVKPAKRMKGMEDFRIQKG